MLIIGRIFSNRSTKLSQGAKCNKATQNANDLYCMATVLCSKRNIRSFSYGKKYMDSKLQVSRVFIDNKSIFKRFIA